MGRGRQGRVEIAVKHTKFEKRIIPLHHTASGAVYELAVYSYRHPRATKTFYLQANIHGIEIAGTPILYCFMEYVERMQYRANFIVVPVANPMAVDAQILGTQVGYMNIYTSQKRVLNWNRLAQVKDDSMEAKYFNTLLGISEEANVVFDLHTAGQESVPHVYVHKKHLEKAKRFHLPHIIHWEDGADSFSEACTQRGQVSYTLELGASRTASAESTANGISYLKTYFNNGRKKYTPDIWSRTALRTINCPVGGILEWRVGAGEKIRQKQVMAFVYTRDEIFKLHYPYGHGILLCKSFICAPHQRQAVGEFLTR